MIAGTSARVTVSRGGLDQGDIVASDVQALQKAIQDGLVKPVFFNYDSAELSAEAKSTLEENSRWFRQYPDAGITVEGHCDERGSDEYNLALGESRALAAKNYLVSLGISARQLSVISYGEEKPAVMGSNEAAWAKNRRAEFKAVH